MMRTGPLALFHNSIRFLAMAAKATAITGAADAAAAEAQRARPLEQFHLVEHISVALNYVVQQLLPSRILAKAKRAPRREMRKPTDMKVRAHYQQITRINTEEIASLPPFAPHQALGDDEMTDILLYGSPKSWQKEMDRQGFDPMEHPIVEVVDFMENVESAEDFDGSKIDSKKKSSKTIAKPSKNGELYCMLHGKGNHSTQECNQLKEQAKRMKSNRSNNATGGKTIHKNKTWQKDAAKASAKAKSDLAALIKKTVKKEIAVVHKKRKASDDDSFDLNALDDELKDFNYDQLKDLSINDDEGSVHSEASC